MFRIEPGASLSLEKVTARRSEAALAERQTGVPLIVGESACLKVLESRIELDSFLPFARRFDRDDVALVMRGASSVDISDSLLLARNQGVLRLDLEGAEAAMPPSGEKMGVQIHGSIIAGRICLGLVGGAENLPTVPLVLRENLILGYRAIALYERDDRFPVDIVAERNIFEVEASVLITRAPLDLIPRMARWKDHGNLMLASGALLDGGPRSPPLEAPSEWVSFWNLPQGNGTVWRRGGGRDLKLRNIGALPNVEAAVFTLPAEMRGTSLAGPGLLR